MYEVEERAESIIAAAKRFVRTKHSHTRKQCETTEMNWIYTPLTNLRFVRLHCVEQKIFFSIFILLESVLELHKNSENINIQELSNKSFAAFE